MYKGSQQSDAYFKRQANSSLRPLVSGETLPFGDRPLVAATSFGEQYRLLRKELNEGEGLHRRNPQGNWPARRADLIRQLGDMSRLIKQAARARFEELFVAVANRRLPADVFLLIVQEARDLWRLEPIVQDIPGQSNEERGRAHRKWAKREDARAAIDAATLPSEGEVR